MRRVTFILDSNRFVFFLLAALFILNAISIADDWYFRFSWVDNILHFSGGVWSALLLRAIFRFKRFRPRADVLNDSVLNFGATLSFAALLGVLWEFFEYSSDYFVTIPFDLPRAQLSLIDTISDLFFDLMGGFAVALVSLFGRQPNRR